MEEGNQTGITVGIAAPVLAIRLGLRALLASDASIAITAEGGTTDSLRRFHADLDIVILAGWSMALPQTLELLIQPDSPSAFLMLESEVIPPVILQQLRGRAWGLLPLEAGEMEILAAVRALAAGLWVGAPLLVQPLLAQTPLVRPDGNQDGQVEELTEREIQILQILAQGLSNKQIAYQLKISDNTVKFHISSIYSKLGAGNRADAVRIGARRGMITL